MAKNFDIGIIFSTDTDLLPALEFLVERPDLAVTPEVAGWWGENTNHLLKVPKGTVWGHRLTREDYGKVQDMRSYPQ